MNLADVNEKTQKEMQELISIHDTGKFSFASKVASTILKNGYYSDKQAMIVNEMLSQCSFVDGLELLPISIAKKQQMEEWVAGSDRRSLPSSMR